MGCAAPNRFHWDDLRSRSPESILKQPGVKQSGKLKYTVTFLDALYEIDAEKEQIVEISPLPERKLGDEFQILLVRYLVADYGGPESGVVVSEKDLPGGVTFFQGPHAIPGAPIATLYGTDTEAFVKRCRKFGAEPAPYGDAAMKFYAFPEISATYVLWREDEEFPASVSVLFDKSIIRWFSLDMIFIMLFVLTERLIEGSGIELIPA